VANFGTAHTWIQDSDKFELYADESGKVRFRPAAVDGELVAPAEPGASRAGDGIGIASVSINALNVARVTPTEQVLQRADPDADGDASD
jgi:uncharacterized protein YegP (UPF0339 family)